MNEIKRQLQNVLEEEYRFVNKNEQAVINHIQNRKKKNRKVSVVAISFIALLALVLLAGFWQQDRQLHAKFERYFEEKMFGKDYDILFRQFDYLKEQDALVAFIEYEKERKVIYLAYFEYEDGWEWRQTTGAQNNPYHHERLWSSTVQEPFMYAGVIETAHLDKILVGQKEAHTVKLDNDLTYWFAVSEKAARIVVHKTNGEWVRLAESISAENDEAITVPVVDSLSPTQSFIELKVDTMDRGNKDYYEYPLVVDSSIENLQRGDVITYINNNGQQTISRVLGLPNEKIEIKNGSVITNMNHIAHDYMFAKIMGEPVYEQYMEKMKGQHFNEQEAKNIYFTSFPHTQLAANELFVVPDNWARGAAEVITLDQLRGKIAGYARQNYDALWSEKERDLYTQFKMANDVEIFRGVDPITYVRVQLYAKFLIDEQTNYRMYTSKEGHVLWSESEHMKENTIIGSEKNRFWALRRAKLIERGEFQENGDDGVIKYKLENGDTGIWTMTKSNTGIWQSNFLPIQ
ncbi:S26 family signal peptidase [Solibacillus silvestris]|uniref:S26 family signal peptidase n=1 Tax=Solibacillus silvestris TaxID=76853 RepID=UPI003F814E6A